MSKPFFKGEVPEGIELDVLIAENIGIRGSAFLVFGKEISEDVVPIFLHEVAAEQRESQAYPRPLWRPNSLSLGGIEDH
jgi:hypothetical protein